jgi:hypothetical protein
MGHAEKKETRHYKCVDDGHSTQPSALFDLRRQRKLKVGMNVAAAVPSTRCRVGLERGKGMYGMRTYLEDS